MSAHENDAPVLGAILAGGAARRFGADKALERLGSTCLLRRVADRASPQVDMLAISGAARPGFFLPVIRDDVQGAGPLLAVRSILRWAALRDLPLVATFPCDTPFVPADCVAILRNALRDKDCAIASRGGEAHPTCAMWRTVTAGKLEAIIAAGERSLRRATALLDGVIVNFGEGIGPGCDPFFNINSHHDLARAQAWLEEGVKPL